MNFVILLCLCFICEIATHGSLGYWVRQDGSVVSPKRARKTWARKTQGSVNQDNKNSSRRQYQMTSTDSAAAGDITQMDTTERYANIMRNEPKEIRGDKDSSKLLRTPMKMHGRETTKEQHLRAAEEEDDGKSNVLSSGVLDPYSLKRQLQYIIDQCKSPMNATLEVIGHTVEYNEIILIKMSESCAKKERQDDEDTRRKNIKYEENVAKKVIFIVHNLNPIGANALGYLKKIDNFLDILQMYIEQLHRFDIFLIPVANPDGFTVDSGFWYKNVSPQDGGFGVNLDHNFDVAWKPAIENTCSQFYQGPAPFSEPETKAIRDIFFRHNHNMIAYINIHASSYNSDIYKGDAILYPKGFSDSVTNDDKYVDLKGDIEESLHNTSLHLYNIYVGSMHSWYGKVTGKSVDYASSIYGIPYALEISMQPYEDQETPKIPYKDIFLNEIWDRIFKVIFNSIDKSLQKTNDDHMRRFDLF